MARCPFMWKSLVGLMLGGGGGYLLNEKGNREDFSTTKRLEQNQRNYSVTDNKELFESDKDSKVTISNFKTHNSVCNSEECSERPFLRWWCNVNNFFQEVLDPFVSFFSTLECPKSFVSSLFVFNRLVDNWNSDVSSGWSNVMDISFSVSNCFWNVIMRSVMGSDIHTLLGQKLLFFPFFQILLFPPRRPYTSPGIHCIAPKDGLNLSNVKTDVPAKVAIVRTLWNSQIVDSLVQGAMNALEASGVAKRNIFEIAVPGSYELPYAAKLISKFDEFDAIICIGCLIKGETMHFEYIADAVTHALMKLQMEGNTPVIFGVLTCMNLKQAEERAREPNGHGFSWGITAVHMINLRRRLLPHSFC